ncbi:MAG: aminotransferase class I/II-fold pyridoxal phosphate-dependent enzyme [Anaeromyxobacteraceae bacterium]
MTKSRIYLSVPHIGPNEESYVHEAFATNWMTTVGANLDAFEKAFSERIGQPCVALASGTAAIHLGLMLLGVGPGDEVMVSDLTFVASVNPIRYLGAEPVLVDSDRSSWNMDPALLASALEDRARRGKLPRAVVVVDLYGQSADMDPIVAACRKHGVPVLEDAAEAVGTLYRGRPAGTSGDVNVFSFNGNKIITTTSGGMLASPRRDWVEKARFWSQQSRDPRVEYHHTEIGFNYRMSNVLAGIGRGQLEVVDLRVRQRRGVFERYREAFADLPGLEPMPEAPFGLHTRWLSCFLVDEAALGVSRDGILAALAAESVEGRPVWKPMHLQPLYAGCDRYGGEVGADLYQRGLCLPSSSSLTSEEQARVVSLVRKAAGRV